MRVRMRTTAIAVTATMLISLAGVPASAQPGLQALAAGENCQAPVDYTQTATVQSVVNRLDVGNHESESVPYDRVVIGLTKPASNYQVRYVPQIIQDGSGDPVPLRGNADIEVRLDGTQAHNDSGGSTVPVRDNVRDWRSLKQAKLVSDFEGVVLVGIGVAQRVDFTVSVLTGPDRLVIDLAMPGAHPWNCTSGAVKVYFLNEPRFVANTPPFFTPVNRRVRVPAIAGGALSSLFHGPLLAEEDTGLRFLSSDATGFTGLQIASQVARVQLTGGCNAHGSTVNISGSIMPTLKQFSNVQYVKIYDPAGRTSNPTGLSDSIPDCLNP